MKSIQQMQVKNCISSVALVLIKSFTFTTTPTDLESFFAKLFKCMSNERRSTNVAPRSLA